MTVRNLSDETLRALKAQAMRHRRSLNAEIRHILQEAVSPPERVRLGSLLAEIGREVGLTDDDLDDLRDRTPSPPVRF